MNRQTKYPETDTFHFYNANPRNRITGDCAFRAIATALEQDYNQTVMEMAECMCKTGYALNDAKGEDAYLKTKGFIKMKQPRKPDGTKYTAKEFCKLIAKKDERYVAHVGGHHVIAIVDCKVWDIWNSTGGSVGNYWKKV